METPRIKCQTPVIPNVPVADRVLPSTQDASDNTRLAESENTRMGSFSHSRRESFMLKQVPIRESTAGKNQDLSSWRVWPFVSDCRHNS
jgi:hypothetical protein